MRRLAVVLAAAALGPAAGSAHAAQRTLADLGATGLEVRGTTATASVFVPVSPADRVAGGEVVLRYAHSPLLRADRSTLTVRAGGIPLDSVRLTRATARGGVLRVALPSLPDAAGGFLLEAGFSLRLTDDPCEDPRNAGLWARVQPDSTVDTELRAAPRRLGSALATLVPMRRGAALDVVLAPEPSPDALAAAGTIAGALGRQAARVGADPALRVVAGAVAGNATLVVAPGDVPGLAAPRAGQGALAVAASGAPKLTVGGGDGRGLRRAAAALAARRLSPLPGSRALVDGRAPEAPEAALPWREGAASFAQLGIGPREVTGTGTTTIDLAVDRPPQWRLTGDARLDLMVDAGAGLKADSSTVTVVVAGRAVGSRRLQPGRGPARLRFDLDAGLLDTDLDGRAVRRLPIALRFDLDVAEEQCEPVEGGTARVVLMDTSTLRLPHDGTRALDLSRAPAPVAAPGRTTDVVLPKVPSREELTAGLQAAAAIGRWADPRTPLPRVLTSDRLPTAERADHDLVLVGAAGTELGEAVPVPGGARPGAREGMLVVAQSPWNEDRAVLAIMGADGDGLVRAARALTRTDLVTRLSGRAMRVGPAAGLEALAAGDPDGDPPLALAPVIERDRFEDVPPWAVPAGVVLVGLLLIGGLVARRRWGGRTA